MPIKLAGAAHAMMRDFTRIRVDDASQGLFTAEDSAPLLAADHA